MAKVLYRALPAQSTYTRPEWTFCWATYWRLDARKSHWVYLGDRVRVPLSPNASGHSEYGHAAVSLQLVGRQP